MSWTQDLEQRIRRESGLQVGVEDRAGTVVLTGMVSTPEARQAAEDLVSAAVPDRPIENELEVEVFALGGKGTPLEDAVDHTEMP